MLLGVIDEIPDDEEVLHIAHVLNGRQLVFQALCVLAVIVRISFLEAVHAQKPQIIFVVHAVRGMEFRQVKLAERKGHIALLSNLMGIIQRLRDVGEDFAHFIFGLEVELVVGKTHAVVFIDGGRRLNAHQHILRFCILLQNIVHVVGGDERNARLLMEPLHIRQNLRFLLQTLILQFQIEIALAKNIFEFQSLCLGSFVISI